VAKVYPNVKVESRQCLICEIRMQKFICVTDYWSNWEDFQVLWLSLVF